jgi:hypothetical protein
MIWSGEGFGKDLERMSEGKKREKPIEQCVSNC